MNLEQQYDKAVRDLFTAAHASTEMATNLLKVVTTVPGGVAAKLQPYHEAIYFAIMAIDQIVLDEIEEYQSKMADLYINAGVGAV